MKTIIQTVNPETDSRFNACINDENDDLKRYKAKEGANVAWIERKIYRLSSWSQYYKEANNVIQNLNFMLAYPSDETVRQDFSQATTRQVRELQKDNARLRAILHNAGITAADRQFYSQRDIKETLRSANIANAREKWEELY